jgi:hypothetical protein
MISGTIKGVLGFVVFVAIATGIVLGGRSAGWWFAVDNANRQTHLVEKGVGFQQGLLTDIESQMTAVNDENVQLASSDVRSNPDELSAITVQRHNTINTICQDAEQVTPGLLSKDQATFVATNCVNGSAK